MGAPLDKGEPDTDLGRGVLGYLGATNRIDDACVRALEVAEPRVERQPPSDSPSPGGPEEEGGGDQEVDGDDPRP